jgi:hypothetical protein
MEPEDLVGETGGKRLEVSKVDRTEVVEHRLILTVMLFAVKMVSTGGVAQLAEAGRLNRPK